MSLSEAVDCPHCSRRLSPGASQGLCPTCLVASLSELLREADTNEAAPTPSLATPNERVGDYELLEELGRGGMGVVFRARDVRLNRIVALKLILTGKLASEAEVKRFLLEAEAVAQLEHPHIVPIYEVGESEGRHFFAMRLVEGGSLAKPIPNDEDRMLKANVGARPSFDLRRSALVISQAARAIQHAHERGILHRDLKPANILLNADGEPMVSDFGLARRVESASDLTLSGAVLGSPNYMAPEQASGSSRSVTIAADIYSLGAILYELLCGHPPFHGVTPLETLRKVIEEEPVAPWIVRRRANPKSEHRNPKEIRTPKSESVSSAAALRASDFRFRASDLDIICLKCLAKDSARRYATAEALADDLDRWLRHEPIHARPSGSWERAGKWVRRRPALAALVVVTFAGLAVLLGVLLAANARVERALEQSRRNEQRATNEAALAAAARNSAESNALTARLNFYAADIYKASQMIEGGQLGTALDLLQHHEPVPGQADVRGFEWHWLHSLCVGDRAQVLRGDSHPLHSLAFSHDGRRMAAGGQETLSIWNTKNWQADESFLSTFPERADAALSVAWSPDGKTLASSGKEFVKFWDVDSGRLRTNCEPGSHQVAFLANGSAIALHEFSAGSTVGGRNLQRMDPATGKTVENLASDITAFAVSANGRWLATVAAHKEVSVRSASNFVELGRFQETEPLLNSALAVSSDGQRVASTAWGSEHVLIYKLNGKREAHSGRLNSQVLALAFSPDDRRLALGMRDSTVRLYDTVSGKALQRFSGHLGEVFAVGWGPRGELISAGHDGAIRIWDQAAPARDAGISNRFYCAVVSPDGGQFAGHTSDSKIILWNGRTPPTRAINDRSDFIPLAFRPEESALLVAAAPWNSRPTIEVWRLSDGATLRSLPLAFARRVMASPRGDRVVTWRAMEAVVYDVAQGKELTRWRAEERPFRDNEKWTHDEGAFTGEYLFACTATHGAALWEVATGKCLLNVQPPNGVETGSVAITPDGTRVLTGDNDHRMRVWDARDGRLLHTLAGHGGLVELLAVSPDSRTLASYAQDRLVKLWSLPTGRELMTMPQRDELFRVLFTPDGMALAVADAWAGARVWRAEAVK